MFSVLSTVTQECLSPVYNFKLIFDRWVFFCEHRRMVIAFKITHLYAKEVMKKPT